MVWSLKTYDMKRNVIILICLGIITSLFSQDRNEGSFAPLNPDFVKYQESKSTAGFIPPTYTVSFDNLPKLRSALTLSAQFDLRTTGLLSTPGNQGLVNACWTFSIMDAIQSVWARMDFETTGYSEENLANCHGYELLKDEGGNADIAMAYLTRFGGPVYESSDPYINNPIGTCNPSITIADKEALVSQAIYIPKDVQTIKQMIYRYGGVMTAMSAWQLVSATYYNPDSFSVFCGSPGMGVVANHAGAIVGWDDNKVIYNPVGQNPSGPGAWIVKGTFGTGKYDGGYFYVSYEDYFVGSYAIVFPQRIEKERVDTVFCYDKLGHIQNYGYITDSATAIVKYTASTQKLITAIGTNTSVASAVLDIAVYQTKIGDVLSGLLGERKGLLCEYPGFHSFDLPISVTGDFYVKIKYRTPGSYNPIPVEVSIDDFATVDVKPVGLQWIKYEDTDTLRTVGIPSRQFNICMKVFAQDAPNQPLFATGRNRYCVNDTVVFKNTSIGSFDSFDWDFGVDATPQTANTTLKTDSFKVVYSSKGLKQVTLKATVGASTNSIVKGNAVEVLSGVPLALQAFSSFDGPALINKQLFLKASGADTYQWMASSYFPDTTANCLTFIIGEASEKFKVTATLGQCVATDSITVVPTDTCALYDDIADAKLLANDTQEGPFSNYCATWRQNEPFPLNTDTCVSQIGWCPFEDKIYSTLWFKFVAPSTDSVKIVTTGFDNKIALYDATNTGTYADIISGNPANYTILAANDDSSDVQITATIESIKLTPGKTYWLQMDGSYGGVKGNAYITIIGVATPLAEVKVNTPYIINPVQQGVLIINNAQSISQVDIIDLSGKTLLQFNSSGDATIELGAASLKAGYYLVKMQTENGIVTQKVLVE